VHLHKSSTVYVYCYKSSAVYVSSTVCVLYMCILLESYVGQNVYHCKSLLVLYYVNSKWDRMCIFTSLLLCMCINIVTSLLLCMCILLRVYCVRVFSREFSVV